MIGFGSRLLVCALDDGCFRGGPLNMILQLFANLVSKIVIIPKEKLGTDKLRLIYNDGFAENLRSDILALNKKLPSSATSKTARQSHCKKLAGSDLSRRRCSCHLKAAPRKYSC